MTFRKLCSIIDCVNEELVKLDVEKGRFEVFKGLSSLLSKNVVNLIPFYFLFNKEQMTRIAYVCMCVCGVCV